jgi:nitroreductase
MIEKLILYREEEVEVEVVDRKSPNGVDIQGKDNSRRNYFIEVEGNKKPNGNPLSSSQKYTHFLRAIGQIWMRMKDDSAVYALGLPSDEYYLKKVQNMAMALRRLNLAVYWVDMDKKVREDISGV